MGQRPELRLTAAPLEGWPVEPTAVIPARQQPLVPTEGRHPMVMAPVPGRRVVGYERYGDLLLPVYEAPPAPQPMAPVEQPRRGMDPVAQRLVAGGVLVAGAGVGGWFLFSAIAAALPGLALLGILVFLCFGGGGKQGGDTINITNHNRWWGRSTTRIR